MHRLTLPRLRPPPPPTTLCSVYREVCRRARVVPATFLEQHLHDEAIVMNDHGLGPEGGVAAATALRRHKSLRVLELANNDLGSGGVAAVASALAAIPQLESLDLSGNGVGREGIRKVSRALGRTSRLQRLVLARNSFLDLDSAPLAAALKENRSLLTLSLADNRFGDVAGLRFGAMLGDNKTLLELDLSRNCIRKRGGTALGQAMVANGTLVKLVLSHNGVGDDGALEFSSSLRSNGTIERLDMSGCRITAVGASGLAQALKSNGTLQHLDIGYNPIACAGVRDILSALLEANRSLRVLVIDGIPLDEETLALLQRLLAARPDLEIRYSRPGHASSVDGMREQLLALKARNARKRAPNRMRRRSSTLALELGPDGNPLRRWPSSQYDPSWSDEEKRRHGYNPDGTPRTDGAWLAGLAEYDEGWSDEKKRDMGYNPDGTQRDDTEWQNIQRMRNGSAKGLAADQFSSSSESESSEFESDDEMAKIRHHRRHLRLCTRRFSKMYPGVDDPMAVLERYVDANKLRFVDLFFQMDRDRSGSLETEEVESAIKLMDLDLSHLQLTELMTRMDLDGDGMCVPPPHTLTPAATLRAHTKTHPSPPSPPRE